MKKKLHFLALFLLLHSLVIFRVSGQQQADPFAAASLTYRNKDYAKFLENMLLISKIAPDNVGLLEFLAKAYALNHQPEQALEVLRAIAALGGVANLGHNDFSSLKDHAALPALEAALQKNRTVVNKSVLGFTLGEKDLIPEGIAFDQQSGDFYLGSIYKRKIIRLSASGKKADFTAPQQDGMMNPLGLKVDAVRRHLWVCVSSDERDKENGAAAIFKYSLRTGKLINKYEVGNQPQAHLFNDLDIQPNGDVYFTDSLSGAVHKISVATDRREEFIAAGTFTYPNGIALAGKFLYVADERGIHRIEIANKKIQTLRRPNHIALAGMDGLYWHNHTLIGVQNGFNPERIVQIKLNPAGDQAVSLTLLEMLNPWFLIPTTGALAADGFYYIANSQLRAINGKGEITSPEKLAEIVILKIPQAAYTVAAKQ
ncbi:MAG: SMP-30/gluconolactonase/LRE family protein [Acidobacteria bacterium]|nr:SMP-30/gluconolactonase/LRE family protein [Acidobacteriota bacterium]